MGKGGSTKVKETSAEKAQAAVAADQWSYYQNNLKQYEDLFMDKVDNLNNESNYDNVAGDAATQTSSAFGEARDKTAANLAASGVDPTSGKYQSTMKDITDKQSVSQLDTVSRAQNTQADKYTAGLSDVVAIGNGQEADALSGYSSLANSSASKAQADAESAFNSHSALTNGLGTAAGLYAAYGSKSGGSNTNNNGSALNNSYLVSGTKH